jgi:beta-lactamase superfamily II metal-dependent hydrolase
MTCKISFLPVGNADCIVVHTDNSVVVVDLGKNPRFIYKWLRNNKLNKINKIYITHKHQDHFPFLSLVHLVEFLTLWFSNSSEIEIFSLPYGIYNDAREKLNIQRGVNADYRDLEDALNSLDDWDRSRRIRFVEDRSDPTPYSLDSLKIYTLHPRLLFIGKPKININEISLVLRVVYGEFTAMLLADLEGEGLKDYLSVVKASADATKEAKANIVKIPHHGGYPSNGDDLKDLLAFINPELAVLSVGSTNLYGHVKPELFKALIELKDNPSYRLERFICTEVTRTCVYLGSDQLKMRRTGLPKPEPCAGEITIIADISGKWELKTETTNHPDKIASFAHAACDGRADLA